MQAVYSHILGETDPTPFPDVDRLPITYTPSGRLQRQIPDHHALYDKNTATFFGIVSPKYEIVRHEDISEQLEEVMARRGLKPEIRTDFSNHGSSMKRTYFFKEEVYKLKDGDEVSPSLYFFNSYDKKLKLRLDLGAFRWVCSNGLMSGERFFQVINVHKAGSINFQIKDLDRAFDNFNDQIQTWSRWDEQEATVEDLIGFLAAANLSKSGRSWIEREITSNYGEIDKKESTDEITKIPLMSYWALYNVFTAYTTHQLKTNLHSRTMMENRIRAQLRG